MLTHNEMVTSLMPLYCVFSVVSTVFLRIIHSDDYIN